MNPQQIALGALGIAGSVLAAFMLIAPQPWVVEGGPAFFVPDRDRAPRANVWIGLWWAAAFNLVMCTLLAASARWWAAPLETPPSPGRSARASALLSRRFLALILLAVLAGLALRAPLATRSLWWDEAWTIRQVVVGRYTGPDGVARAEDFQAGGLERSLFYARKPTNHALYSVAAWTSNSAWRALHPGPPHRFSELAYRLPALVASALCIALIALVCAQLGFGSAGLLAAWLFALHPWAIRYGAEGRAYGFVMLFTLLGVLALLRFLRGRRWPDLLLYTGSQVLLLWTWSYAAFVTLGLAGAGALALLRSGGDRATRGRWVARFAVANLLALMGFFQVFGPNLTLARTWGVYTGEVLPRLPAVAAGLATGMLTGTAGEAPDLPDLAARIAESSWVIAMLALLFVALLGGLRATWQAGGPARFVTLGWLAAPAVAVLVTDLTGRHFYPRFLLFALPLVIVLTAIGLTQAASLLAALRPGPAGRVGAALVVTVAVGGWLAITLPQLAVLTSRPYAPLRDVAETLAAEPDAIHAGLGFGTGVMRIYTPTLYYLDSTQEIQAMCQRARSEARPLLVFSGYPVHNTERADAIAWLEDPTRFDVVADFRGIEPAFYFRVFRARQNACGEGAALFPH